MYSLYTSCCNTLCCTVCSFEMFEKAKNSVRARFHEEGEKRRVHSLMVSIMEVQEVLCSSDAATNPTDDEWCQSLPPDINIVQMEDNLRHYLNQNLKFIGKIRIYI